MPREENPVVEIRSKLGEMAQWHNVHTDIAHVLYTDILETLNLTTTNGRLRNICWLDVELEVDGRHALCDHIHKLC